MKKIDTKNKLNVFAFIASIVIVVAGYSYYSFYLADVANVMRKLSEHNDRLRLQVQGLEALKVRQVKLEQDLIRAENEFERLKEMFPDEEQVPNRLRDLYGVLRNAGVKIRSFTPRAGKQQEYYTENVYSVSLEAGYHMMGHLFAEMANFGYPTKITNLRLTPFPAMKSELEKAAIHGWTPITVTTTFDLITFSSRRQEDIAKKEAR
jgi:type IV pilus assembly protein PilO